MLRINSKGPFKAYRIKLFALFCSLLLYTNLFCTYFSSINFIGDFCDVLFTLVSSSTLFLSDLPPVDPILAPYRSDIAKSYLRMLDKNRCVYTFFIVSLYYPLRIFTKISLNSYLNKCLNRKIYYLLIMNIIE